MQTLEEQFNTRLNAFLRAGVGQGLGQSYAMMDAAASLASTVESAKSPLAPCPSRGSAAQLGRDRARQAV